MAYERVLVFGDIHACYAKFSALLAKVKPDPTRDFIIFLGDYVDRGEDVTATLDYIMDLKAKSNQVVTLMGNHEWMMDLFFGNLDGKVKEPTQHKDSWMYGQNGGQGTYSALKKREAKEPGYMAKVFEFVASLPYTYEMDIGGRVYFFTHGGVDPSRPLNEQKEMDLVWHREEFYDRLPAGAFEGRTFVVGHTPVQYLKYFVLDNGGDEGLAASLRDDPKPVHLPQRDNIIFMDTGSYLTGGRISCRDFLSGQLWQA
ncbi:MAG: serine/threonine protein phosphatase [Selenomonadaceae bacterium]|nr:serine/threonine protein phosphatase [Selenomonadaceae bacterium]